jgi:hypothetical protein
MGIRAGETKKDYSERLFEFTEMVKEFLNTLPSSQEHSTIITGLSSCVSNLLKNNNDTRSGTSKAAFMDNAGILLRYIIETDCWLRIMKRHVNELNTADLDYLIRESVELKNILRSIAQKSN